jgi:hypothetical protein
MLRKNRFGYGFEQAAMTEVGPTVQHELCDVNFGETAGVRVLQRRLLRGILRSDPDCHSAL